MPSIAHLSRLLAVEPDDAFLLYALAQEHAKAGNTADALANYDRCLAADPNYAYAYYHKAKALLAVGRTDEAVAVINRGLEIAPSCDPKAASELATLLDQLR